MKAIAAALVLLLTQPSQKPLTVSQVLSWPSYYGLPLDKGAAAALEVFGPSTSETNSSLSWRPGERTGWRALVVKLGPGGKVLRVTVFPHPQDTLTIPEILHDPERFVFQSGHDKGGQFFEAETRNRQLSIRFACSPDRDPVLESITVKSTANPDESNE